MEIMGRVVMCVGGADREEPTGSRNINNNDNNNKDNNNPSL